ncbi:MAG: DUF3857 domain-containing transglutaminase family protein [Chryseolinea sp.]
MRVSQYFAAIVTLCLSQPVSAAEIKYPVSEIPEEMKTGMYAVVREKEEKFMIMSTSNSTYVVRCVITILKPEAKRLATLAVWYDKAVKIDYMRASVYDASGALIKKLRANEIEDGSNISDYSLYEDDRYKAADLGQATYPYTIEYEYAQQFSYLMFIPGFTLIDDDEVAIQKSNYELIYPKTLKPRYKLNQIKEPVVSVQPDRRECLTWTFQDVKPNKFEKFSTGNQTPSIRVAPVEFAFKEYGGNMSTWESYGKWLAQLNKDRDVLPESTKTKVKELTKDLKTTEEKVKAVYEYVQGKTRYVSIQLGIGGWQPFPAETVDKTGYGDCKALSNYTVALLKEAGIKSYYATIKAGENESEILADFPSSQFNHIIVGVPNGSDTLWLECTSQINPFGYLGTFTGDRKALMVTETGGKLVNTIKYTADQNTQMRKATVTVLATGDATAKINTVYKGLQYETNNLNSRISRQYNDQKEWILNNTKIPSFDINSFSMKDTKDKIPSASVNLDLSLKRYVTVSGKRLFLTPNLMSRSASIPEKGGERKTDVVTKTSFTSIDSITYQLPEGIYPEFTPAPITVKSRFGEYEANFILDAGKLLYVRKLKMKKGTYPKESYNELVEFYRSLNKADNTKMVFLNKT